MGYTKRAFCQNTRQFKIFGWHLWNYECNNWLGPNGRCAECGWSWPQVARADQNLGRYAEEMVTIELQHGAEMRQEIEDEINSGEKGN